MQIPRTEPDYDGIYKKMVVETACHHTKTQVRKKLASDGAISIWHQCLTCGKKIPPAIRKATLTQQQIDALPIWDIEVEKQFYKNREKHHHQMLHTERDRLEQDWQQRYEAYLKSAEWQQKRQLVLARVQGICEGCRSAVATEVHHLTYADVGSEFLFQLVAMCRPCHDRFHTPPPQPAAAAVPPSKTQESWP